MSQRITSLLAVPLACLLLLANRSVRESYDLQPRFEKGQKLSIQIEAAGTFELASAEISVGGELLPYEVGLDYEGQIQHSSDETILAAEGGEVSQLEVTITGGNYSLSGDADFMGQNVPLDEGGSLAELGHTFLVTRTQHEEDDPDEEHTEDDVEVEDISDDSDLDQLSDGEVTGVGLDNHFEDLLPVDPIEVGDTWELGGELADLLRQSIIESEGETDQDEIVTFLDTIQDAAAFTFTGTLSSVDEMQASISWELEARLDDLDVIELLRGMDLGDEIDENIPPGSVLSCSALLTMEGSGVFDLEVHQLSEVTFEGGYTISVNGAADLQGTSSELNVEFEGTLEFSGGVDVQ